MAYCHVRDAFLHPLRAAPLIVCLRDLVTAEDIAEEIVWAAARPPHVNIAEVYVLPVNQASATLSFRGGSK